MKAVTRWDDRVFRAERWLAGRLLVLMGAVIFLDVVHRVASRSPGRLAVLISGLAQALGLTWTPAQLDAGVAPAISGAVFVALCFSALRVRKPRKATKGASRDLGLAIGIAGLLWGLVWGFVTVMPAGLAWAPYFGLCLLLWSGLLGASMASHQGSHLSLEMGEKLWPKRWRGGVGRFAALVVALFCGCIAALGATSVADHFNDWQSAPGAGLVPSIEWPKWVVFTIVPYAFGMMALRALARAVGWVKMTKNEVLPGVGDDA